MNQIQLHKEWNEDVDFAIDKLEMLITKLNQIKIKYMHQNCKSALRLYQEKTYFLL